MTTAVLRSTSQPARTSRLMRAAALFAGLAAAALLGLPMCPFALLSGHPCPGCGMTRAAMALANGDWTAASGYNPTALLTVPLSAGLVLFFVGSYLYDGKLRASRRLPQGLAVATIALLTVVWIARALGAFGGPVAV